MDTLNSSLGVRQLSAGKPWPIGATFDGEGVNFALFSAAGEGVELCLFDERGEKEVARLKMTEYSDEVWHGYLPGARPGLVYGFRVRGCTAPKKGLRFNAHKLLIDPYARAFVGEFRWTPAQFAYTVSKKDGRYRANNSDNAADTLKAVVHTGDFDWEGDKPPGVPLAESILYEVHVKGFTMQHPGVLEPARGTYEGMASEAAIAHFKRLGITALSLLPVHQSIPEKFIVDRGLTNYWGYSTIGFFAPDRRHARADPVAEFKTMVKRLHAAGLEVIIDVVYNHTAEGDQLGPTLSFRGIDNLAYYRLIAGDLSLYDNGTGCGNSVNVAHQRVLQLVMDSLRYWVTDMHVDGFRFDLATTVAREPGGFDVNGGFLDAVRQDPVLSRVKLIAEPWDIGLGGYQLGAFAPGWSEWNGQFRDTARSFWVQRQATRGELAGRLAASHELFGHRGRRPQASINFVTAHDGFTLRDLVMYNDKHNEANGEDNRDGTDDNRSWNCGIEGPSDDAEIEAQRARLQRTLLATLFLSQGVPMMLGGDELSRTQQGNNNAYCQDNEINWFQWQDADQRLIDYTAHLIDLRKRYPTLRRTHWLQGVWGETGEHDVRWLDATGADIPDNEWSDATKQAFAMLLPKWDDSHPTILLLFNGADHGVIFTLPEGTWTMVLDTDNDEVAPRSPPGELIVAARGIVVLEKAADRRDSP